MNLRHGKEQLLTGINNLAYLSDIQADGAGVLTYLRGVALDLIGISGDVRRVGANSLIGGCNLSRGIRDLHAELLRQSILNLPLGKNWCGE